MKFEYDEAKSQINKAKHGIDFVQAQALWLDENLISVPASTENEPRHIGFGKINGKHWAGVFTYRGKTVRIISVRRARDKEVIFYENNIGQ
jgi:uncharacterized DUF497 family protein